MSTDPTTERSRPAEPPGQAGPSGQAVHGITIVAVCLVWPLIWVGGMVTTYDAGMAVPDWPGTYGYNLFLYPYKTWLFGPFDLLVEHGHRLLGAILGIVAIALVAASFWSEPRRWVRGLGVAVLLAVIGQGVLGGMRVLQSDRTLAMVHGCTASGVFAMCVIAAVVTSRWWWRVGSEEDIAQRVGAGQGGSIEGSPEEGNAERGNVAKAAVKRPGRIAVALTAALVAISYGQLVLGALLRHVQPGGSPGGFAHTVAMHVLTAFLLWGVAVLVWWSLRRCGDLTLSRPGLLLIGLIGFQIAFGIGTWVVKYGYPGFLEFMPGATDFVIRAKGWGNSLLITAHVATGSLIFAVGTMLLVRLIRFRHVTAASKGRLTSVETLATPRGGRFAVNS